MRHLATKRTTKKRNSKRLKCLYKLRLRGIQESQTHSSFSTSYTLAGTARREAASTCCFSGEVFKTQERLWVLSKAIVTLLH